MGHWQIIFCSGGVRNALDMTWHRALQLTSLQNLMAQPSQLVQMRILEFDEQGRRAGHEQSTSVVFDIFGFDDLSPFAGIFDQNSGQFLWTR